MLRTFWVFETLLLFIDFLKKFQRGVYCSNKSRCSKKNDWKFNHHSFFYLLIGLPLTFAISDSDLRIRVTCGAPLLLSQQCSQYLRLNHIPPPSSQWENCLMVSLSLSRPYLRYSPYLWTRSTQTSRNLCRYITFELRRKKKRFFYI